MTQSVHLERVLLLPAIDIAAMLRGQLIVALPRVQIQPGTPCLLAPMGSPYTTPEQCYRSPFLPLAQTILNQIQGESIHLEAWAVCEKIQMIHEMADLAVLSSLTIWHQSYLEKLLQERQYLFLSHLKVHRLPDWISVPVSSLPVDKLGKVVGLPSLGHQGIAVTEILPVVSDRLFAERKQQLAELRPPDHPELEELHRAIAQVVIHDPKVQQFEQELKVFLGWTDTSNIKQSDPDLAWIKTITETGNSSDGHQFEKLVRKSLIKLGFSNSRNNPKASLDPEATGGAGGIDFYCDAPYPVVGECKATKSEKVPSKTPGQLIQLGKNHLQDDYDPCVKIIFAAGELTTDAELTTINHQMNVIRPETLQRLVELNTRHPGVINLIDLRSCLERSPFGTEADEKVNQYVEQLQQDLVVRSHIVAAVKQLTKPNKTQLAVIEIRTHYNARFAKSDALELDDDVVHELLIELSSPLVGYLGRLRATSMQSDRFYFLRDLPEPNLLT